MKMNKRASRLIRSGWNIYFGEIIPPRAIELLCKESDKVYLEFRIIAGFRDKYIGIGNKGSLFSRDEAGDRALLLKLLEPLNNS